jgi:hypothetical protein
MERLTWVQPRTSLLVPLLLGALVVVLGRIIPGLSVGHEGGGESFAEVLLVFFDGGFLVLLVINEIPFLAVAGLLYWLQRKRRQGEEPPVAVWAGAWLGLLLLAATVLAVHLLTWLAVFGGGEGASTSVIALFLAPIYGSLAWLLGFTVGTLGLLTFAHR